MQKIFAFIKAHKIIFGLLVLGIAGAGIWYFKSHSRPAQAQYVTAAAEKTTITAAVSASGQVSAENQIDLKPASSGALTSMNVKAGDEVRAGQTIAQVDESNNNVQLAQARAQVLQAQANYDKLVTGLTGTDLALAQSTLNQVQTGVDRAYSNLLNSGLAAVSTDSSAPPVTITGSYTEAKEGTYTIDLYGCTAGVCYRTSGLGNTIDPITPGVALPIGNDLYITFASTANLFGGMSYTINVPNKSSSAYFTNLNAYNSAKTALSDAQLQFTQKTAPPNPADVSSAKASLLSAQAGLQAALNNYNDNILKAPFDGVIAAANSKKNDQVTAATVVASLITKQQLATVALNEVDVAKVKVGQKVTLTFDAIDDLSITGEVAQVDTLGTTTQGVVSYNVKIAFDTQDDRIKPSMSVTANIITDVKTDVLAVPNSAVKTQGNTKYVQMLDSSGQPQNKNVEVGLSNDTMTEIISGLNEGDEVVTQTITPSSATPAKTTTSTGIPGLGGNAANRNRTFMQIGR